MAAYRVKGWQDFQHYTGRTPPWIKLHRKLLDDRKYNSLPLASMALAPLVWLLASETKDGIYTGTAEDLAFRLRWKIQNVEAGLKPLVAAGFLIEERDASGMLAERLQDACPETEGETEGETDKKPAAACRSDFEAFWRSYPTNPNMPKKKAFAAWERLSPAQRVAATSAVPGFRTYCEKNPWYKPIYADRFLSQEKFEGYSAQSAPDPAAIEAAKDRADRLLKRGKYAETYQ
jgi:hypothetical protein